MITWLRESQDVGPTDKHKCSYPPVEAAMVTWCLFQSSFRQANESHLYKGDNLQQGLFFPMATIPPFYLKCIARQSIAAWTYLKKGTHISKL